jgi:hypothetical protein
MRVAIIHHFWRNNEKATWVPDIFPVPEIEAAVKRQYTRLANDRPPWETFGEYCVFFAYKPSKDVFGRDTMPISFAFIKHCHDPERCAGIIGPLLQKTEPPADFLEVHLPWEEISQPMPFPKPKPAILKRPVIGLLLTLILVLATILVYKRDSNYRPGEIGDNTLNSLEIVLEPAVSALPFQPDEEPPVTALPLEVPKLASPDPDCLPDDLAADLYPCPKEYANQRCQWQGPGTFDSFKKWVESKTRHESCSRGYGLTKYHKNDAQLTKEQSNELQKFFK